MIRDDGIYFISERWMKDAACTDPSVNPDWWFPVNEQKTNIELQIAINICNECPVRRKCLEFVMDNWPMYGIWAGHTQRELKNIKKKKEKQNEHKRSA